VQALSRVQAKVYELLRAAREHGEPLPEPVQLAQTLGVRYSTLNQHLNALAKKGYIRFESRGAGRRPMLELRLPPGIPLVGSIPAGPLSDALEHPEGYLALPFGPEHFALRVKGDSMAEPIQDGDVVILRRTPEFHSGDVCAVRVNGDEATLKYVERYQTDASLLLLRPHNPDYDPVKVLAKDTFIAGVYRGLLRGDAADVLLVEGDVS
jgi:repressor LexA